MSKKIRPVVIVDPFSSGSELAPAFKKHGIPSIAVIKENVTGKGFGLEIKSSDFEAILTWRTDLNDILQNINPLAIIPGSETGVDLADTLSAALTPHLANDPRKMASRIHKAHMQEALKIANVPHLKTTHSSSLSEIEKWLEENELCQSPLILKPPISAGSDKVFHISAGQDWRKAFRTILSEPTKVGKSISASVVVQEQAIGTEYAVGTISAHGKHSFTHLIKYTKTTQGDRKTIYDYVEFVDFNQEIYRELLDYTQKILNALGVRWGAAHTEIILTDRGPRLIEVGARMCGGPVMEFSRVAYGSCQADKMADIYAQVLHETNSGNLLSSESRFIKTVVPIFLKSSSKGVIKNMEILEGLNSLPSFFKKYIWYKNGDLVSQTEDYLSSLGIVAMAGEREQIFADYKKVREAESNLILSAKF